jgi:hypothetical protein
MKEMTVKKSLIPERESNNNSSYSCNTKKDDEYWSCGKCETMYDYDYTFYVCSLASYSSLLLYILINM